MAHRSSDFSRWGTRLGKIPDDGWLIHPSIIWRKCECRSAKRVHALRASDY
jgi:hypothetical protein